MLRPIPGFPGYLAGPDGEIVSTRVQPATRLAARMHKGYLHVSVRGGTGKSARRKMPVHQLVLLAYEGPKPFPQAVTRHLDGDALNNRPGNLAWGTVSENIADSIRHGTAICLRRGAEHPRTRLLDEDLRAIRAACDDGETYSAVGRAFRIDPAYASRIHRGLDRAPAP